jgi:moderate conductance mechanosensitive channel
MTLLRQAVRDTAAMSRPRDWFGAFDFSLVLPRLINVAVVLVLALIAFRLLRIVIARIVAREVEDEDPIMKRAREQRAQTIASLLGNVALIVIMVITVLTILDTFMNIAPLLASVGVIGLAVSFGAQSLVKDVISGTFMLMEGQFGIGDIIRAGDVAGLVEKVTLRTTILRDAHGVVHIIPNGEITRVSNMTKNWSRAVLDIGVAYRENVDHVIEVLAGVGRELRADPEWRPLLIEEPEVLGVENFGESAVVIRMWVKTLPLKQWLVSRELRRRIKNRFDEVGIEIPFPHTTLYWGAGQAPWEKLAAGSGDEPSADNHG